MKAEPIDTSDPSLAQIEAFEARYRYDGAYMKDMLRDAPEAYRAFEAFLPMASFRKEAPRDAYFVAKIAAFRRVDCGPCLQLAVRRAQEAGVPAPIVAAAALDQGELSETLARARRFAEAILDGHPDCDRLRQELAAELGAAAVVELALAAASAQIFPVMKRATGHYKSCSLVKLEV